MVVVGPPFGCAHHPSPHLAQTQPSEHHRLSPTYGSTGMAATPKIVSILLWDLDPKDAGTCTALSKLYDSTPTLVSFPNLVLN